VLPLGHLARVGGAIVGRSQRSDGKSQRWFVPVLVALIHREVSGEQRLHPCEEVAVSEDFLRSATQPPQDRRELVYAQLVQVGLRDRQLRRRTPGDEQVYRLYPAQRPDLTGQLERTQGSRAVTEERVRRLDGGENLRS
jgi:hypothetical protein